MASDAARSVPGVCAVMPTYNGGDLLASSVESVLASTYPELSLVVVDDGSTDGSIERILDRWCGDPRLSVVRHGAKRGPAAARNSGVETTDARYVAFLETDMEVEPGWLEPLVAELEADPGLGGAQSLVLDLHRRDLVQAAGILIVPQVGWVVSLGFGLSADEGRKLPSREASIGAVGSVVRRDAFLKAGGFDEALVHNVDDIDMGWRIWLAGYRIKVVPTAIAYHWTAKPPKVRERATDGAASEFHTHKMFRIFLKNYSLPSLARYLPSAFAILAVRALVNAGRGNLAPVLGFARGVRWTVTTLPDTLEQRRRIQRMRRVSDRYLRRTIMVQSPFLRTWKEKIKPSMEASRLFQAS